MNVTRGEIKLIVEKTIRELRKEGFLSKVGLNMTYADVDSFGTSIAIGLRK